MAKRSSSAPARLRSEPSAAGLLRIGEFARRCDVTVATLRYYENRGLVSAVRRDESGYRWYDASLVQEIRLIAQILSVGLSLEEIRSIVAPDGPVTRAVDADTTIARMQRAIGIYESHLVATDAEIEHVKRRRKALTERIAFCRKWTSTGLVSTPAAPRVAERRVRPGRVEYDVR